MLLGTAAVDITPPVGTPMAGSLQPRTSVEIDDPLLRKAMVLANDGTRLALVTLGVRDREPFQAEEIRAKWPAGFEVFESEDRLLKADPQDEVVTVVQAVRIGDGAIAATPGETFAQLGLDIKQRSPYPVTAAAELCNDIIGYIPTREAFGQGGYETSRSRWAQVVPGSGEKLADRLVDMLGQM